jgi:hypothetical protein
MRMFHPSPYDISFPRHGYRFIVPRTSLLTRFGEQLSSLEHTARRHAGRHQNYTIDIDQFQNFPALTPRRGIRSPGGLQVRT